MSGVTPWDVVGAGADALLLPALSSVSARAEMRPLAAALGRRCVIPDWPGFGDAPRQRAVLTPAAMAGFVDRVLGEAIRAPALGVAAGHAAAYLVGAARRHPGAFSQLVLIAPTWRGPFPTMLHKRAEPDRQRLLGRIRRALDAPVLGPLLYRATTSGPMVGRMMRAHVYADPARVTPEVLAAKRRIVRQPDGRLGTAAFITGGLDPVDTRGAFLALFGAGLPPILMLRPEQAPGRSAAEMDALAATGAVTTVRVPGALAAHEEYPEAVAPAIADFLTGAGLAEAGAAPLPIGA